MKAKPLQMVINICKSFTFHILTFLVTLKNNLFQSDVKDLLSVLNTNKYLLPFIRNTVYKIQLLMNCSLNPCQQQGFICKYNFASYN